MSGETKEYCRTNAHTVIEVDLSPVFNLANSRQKIVALLDMLRFAGLLQSNVTGFPDVIRYIVNHSEHYANISDVRRWASFGFFAKIVDEG